MIEILKNTEILNTPKGIAICGAYSTSSGQKVLIEVIKEMGKKLDGITRVYYKSHEGNYQHLSIKDIQYNTSVGDGINLFLLLGDIELPKEIKKGATIYSDID